MNPARRMLLSGLGVLALAGGGVAWGAASISASVDQSELTLDEVLELEVTISEEASGGAFSPPTPTLPDLSRHFVQLGRPGYATSLMSDGRTSTFQVRYRYRLQPLHTGKAVVGPIRVRTTSGIKRTSPIVVLVRPGAGRTASPSAPPVPGSRQPAPPPGAGGDEVLLRLALDHHTAFVGQQVTATLSICYRVHLADIRPREPDLTGLTVFKLPPRQAHTETIDHTQYMVEQLRYALFAGSPGTRTIGAASAEYLTSFWEQPNTVQSKPATLRVLPLPKAGRPAGFAGLVGRFRVEAQADRREAKAGEAVTVRATVEGRGNLHEITAPALVVPPDARQYKSGENVENAPQPAGEGYVMGGQAHFEYVVIPGAAGELRIPPVELAYFDPGAKRYRLARSDPIVVRVAPGNAAALAAARGHGGAVATPRLAPRRFGRSPGGGLLTALVALHVLGLGWLAVAAGARVVRLRREQDPAGACARSALARARQALVAARSAPPVEAEAQVSTAVRHFLADRLGVNAAALAPAEAGAAVASAGASPRLAEDVQRLLERCDLSRFAPVTLAGSAATVEEARRTLGGLDGALPRVPFAKAPARVVGRT